MATGDSLRTLEVKKGDQLSAKRHNDLLRRVADMASETPARRRPSGSGGSSSTFPFQIYKTDTLKIKMRAGTVMWHSYHRDVALSAEQTLTPSTSTYFWLIISAIFPASPPPTFTLGSGSAWPTEALDPAKQLWRIGQVDTDANDVTLITQFWEGNIPWHPVLTFWA